MWELDSKESWALKNWCFWTVVLEETLESPLDCKEIQPIHPKGNQSLIFTGRTYAEAETPILWPPVVKNWLIGKDPDAGKDWRQEKGMTEDEMIEWHHWLNGYESEQAPGVGDGQGSLAWWTGRPGVLHPMGLQRVGHDWATELNWTKKTSYFSCQGYFSIHSSIQSLSCVWLSTVHEVAKSRTQLSAHTHTQIHVLVVAWREKFF